MNERKGKDENNKANNVNYLDEIKKAKELLDNGAITEEEFQKIKDNYIK